MDEREWRDLIWSELKDLRNEVKELRSENRAILETMTTLKVKIGVVASIASGMMTLAWDYLQKKFGA